MYATSKYALNNHNKAKFAQNISFIVVICLYMNFYIVRKKCTIPLVKVSLGHSWSNEGMKLKLT